ncbi:MAG: DNA-directed RNA polymerase subunit omega [Pseudoflavonifractor sp.]
MMLKPPMKDLLAQVPSRYMLVNVIAKRARQISNEAEESGIPLDDKPVSMAIHEVADGKCQPEIDE